MYFFTCGVKPGCGNYFLSVGEERVCKIFFYKCGCIGAGWFCYLADFAEYLWLTVQAISPTVPMPARTVRIVWPKSFLLEPFPFQGKGAGRRIEVLSSGFVLRLRSG